MSSEKETIERLSRRKTGKGSKNEKSHSRKRSLSRSLQNLFHRKHSYSLKPDNNAKGKKLFDSINDGNSSESAHGTRMSRAQVWLVRNSMSKSPVEDIGIETGRFIIEPGLPAQRKNSGNKPYSHGFDTLKHIEQFLHVNKERTVSKDQDQYNQCKQSVRKETLHDDHDEPSGACCEEALEKPTEEWDRSRLSSFGSSACYTDSSYCCHSTSNCSCSTRGRSDSSGLVDDDISTSYWDIRLPSETQMTQEYQYERYQRSNSLSVPSVAKSTLGSPDNRTYLAKRRLSVQPEPFYYRTPIAVATTDRQKKHCHSQKNLTNESGSPINRTYLAKRRLSVQLEPFYYRIPEAATDKLKTHCHSQKDLSKESGSPNNRTYLAKRRLSMQLEPFYYRTTVADQLKTHCRSQKDLSNEYKNKTLSEFVEGIENHDHKNTSQMHKERSSEIRRSRSACCDMRRFSSMCRNRRDQEYVKTSKKSICITRSRSVGSSSRRNSLTSRERHRSFNATSQFAFSDIEGSESDSERGSTPEPKDTSSEGKQQSTSNDSSSISACSLSECSSNERNTPNTKKKNLSRPKSIGQDGFQVICDDTEIVGSADLGPPADDVSYLIENKEMSESLESSYRENYNVSELPCIKADLSNYKQVTLANTGELGTKTEHEIAMEHSIDKMPELAEIKNEITLKNNIPVIKSVYKESSAKVQKVAELAENCILDESSSFDNLVKKVDEEMYISINKNVNGGNIVMPTSLAYRDNLQNMLEKSLVSIPIIKITPPTSEFYDKSDIEDSSTGAEGTSANKITGDILMNTFDSDYTNMSTLIDSPDEVCSSNEEKVEKSATEIILDPNAVEVTSDKKHGVSDDAKEEVLNANRVFIPATEISSDIPHDATDEILDAQPVAEPGTEASSDMNHDATLDGNPVATELPSDVHDDAREETLDADAVLIPIIKTSLEINHDITTETLDAIPDVISVTEKSLDVHHQCDDKQRKDTFANEETNNENGTLNANEDDLSDVNYVAVTKVSTEKQYPYSINLPYTLVAVATDTVHTPDSFLQCDIVDGFDAQDVGCSVQKVCSVDSSALHYDTNLECSCMKEDIGTGSATDKSMKDNSDDMFDANTFAIHNCKVDSNLPDLYTDGKIDEKGTELGTVYETTIDLPTRDDNKTVLATKYDAGTEIGSDATNLPYEKMINATDSVNTIGVQTNYDTIGKIPASLPVTHVDSVVRVGSENPEIHIGTSIEDLGTDVDMIMMNHTVTEDVMDKEEFNEKEQENENFSEICETTTEIKNLSSKENVTDTHKLEEIMKDLDTEGLNISKGNNQSLENSSVDLTKQGEELCENGETEMNSVLVYFGNVSEEVLAQACELHVEYTQEIQTNSNTAESSENTTEISDPICIIYDINTQNKPIDHHTNVTDESVQCGMVELEPEFEMTDKSVQVEEPTDQNRNLEFQNVSIDEILFSSGKQGGKGNDVDAVFEAINKEAAKEENKGKDMLVMFIVGGEVKVLRRSGSAAGGGHADYTRTDIPSMTRIDTPQQNGSRDVIFTRSVHNINRGRPKSAVIVTRSQSFNGMAHQPSGIGVRQHHVGPPAVVLGESFRHHRAGPPLQARTLPGSRGAVGFSFKKSPKVPKVPRPNRALLMFQSVKRGVREFIEATKEDLEQLQHRETDHTSTAQQMKSAERYMKRLEFHLAKLDELHEYYLLQQQLREGVRTMHRAYVTSPGNQSHSLSNVKYGYKECTQTMCNIEAQLEAMMGTFSCKLKGMAGFARLCPGDVFEVTVRHGTQKWKTKGRIEKTGNQKWDLPEFTFKAVVGDIFNIKGLEVRAFKSVLLGQKSCETKDLFSANPQLMTVSINVNGSLKLSIVITWNPLDGVEENFTFVETPTRPQGTPRRRPVSVIALNGEFDEDQLQTDRRFSSLVMVQQTKDDNFILRNNVPSHNTHNVTAYHGLDSPHVAGSRLSDHLPDAYKQTGPLFSQTSHHIQAGFHSSPAIPMSAGDSDSNKHGSQPQTQHSAFKHSVPQGVMGHLHFPSVSPHIVTSSTDDEHSVLNIEDILHNLSSSLEDYHGQYSELQKLEELIKYAHKLIRKQFRSSSRSSSISVSIESALEAFDFLDTEDAFEEPKSPTEHTKASFDDMLCSPESTAKTGDSGIESLAQRLSEDTQLGSSLGSSPVPPSTGNEEVDQCLMYHLTYCERVLENLGAFGPLKCREIYALDKLQKQSTIIEGLLKLAKAGPHVDLHNVMSHICEDKSLREFWAKCTDQTSLYIHPDRLLNMLEQKYSSVITEQHMIDATKVCQHIITRVLDIPDYEAERGRSWFVMTLHQFMLYFKDEGGLKHVEDVAKEMKLVERLTSGNSDMVIKAILTLRDTLPSSPCLKVIGMLLVTMDTEVEQCTISYFNLIQKKQQNRDKAMVTFLEGLEDRTPEIRAGACSALAILEASESIDQLVYLWQSDASPLVQKKAKDALLSLGDEGRKAFEDAQLSKHGFQGLQVHK